MSHDFRWGSITPKDFDQRKLTALVNEAFRQLVHDFQSEIVFRGHLPRVITALHTLQQDASSDVALRALVDGDTDYRWELQAGGKIEWGDGTNAPDTNLYRGAANTLKSDDALTLVTDPRAQTGVYDTAAVFSMTGQPVVFGGVSQFMSNRDTNEAGDPNLGSGSTFVTIDGYTNSNKTFAPALVLRHAMGTNSSPAVLPDASIIADISLRAHDGVSFNIRGNVIFRGYTVGLQSASNHGARAVIRATPLDSTTGQDIVQFSNAIPFDVDSTQSWQDSIFMTDRVATPGSDTYGASLAAGLLGSASNTPGRRVAIVARQATSDVDQMGWDFLVHPSATGSADMAKAFRLNRAGDLDAEFYGIAIGPGMVVQKTPAVDVTIPADGSLVVADSYTLDAGRTLTLGAGATLAIV